MAETIRIGICDDEFALRNQLMADVSEILDSKGSSYILHGFKSAEELLVFYKLDSLDLLFLDVQMLGMSGFEAAKTIRETDDKVCIIFITVHAELATEGYRVKAFRYITKPYDQRELESEIAGAMHEIKESKVDTILIKNDSGLHHIPFAQIKYIELNGRKTIIHLDEDNIISNKPLNYFEAKLSGDFIRCHQGYIVNVANVLSVKGNTASVKGNVLLPVSRYKKKNLMASITAYYGGKM